MRLGGVGCVPATCSIGQMIHTGGRGSRPTELLNFLDGGTGCMCNINNDGTVVASFALLDREPSLVVYVWKGNDP